MRLITPSFQTMHPPEHQLIKLSTQALSTQWKVITIPYLFYFPFFLPGLLVILTDIVEQLEMYIIRRPVYSLDCIGLWPREQYSLIISCCWYNPMAPRIGCYMFHSGIQCFLMSDNWNLCSRRVNMLLQDTIWRKRLSNLCFWNRLVILTIPIFFMFFMTKLISHFGIYLSIYKKTHLAQAEQHLFNKALICFELWEAGLWLWGPPLLEFTAQVLLQTE